MFSKKRSDYKILKEIGKTNLAKIYKATTVVDGDTIEITLKMLNISDCDSTILEEIRSDLNVITALHHPDIIAAHAIFIEENFVFIIEPFYEMGDCKKL
mmetsp:Transcript_12180/g.10346  ORF Transcript_12180/g.10346 Transcript_12180/m.10346 type:complete len:99 (-) Transcript_12180:531-827(-)